MRCDVRRLLLFPDRFPTPPASASANSQDPSGARGWRDLEAFRAGFRTYFHRGRRGAGNESCRDRVFLPSRLACLSWNALVESRIDLARVFFVNLPPIFGAKCNLVDVALCIVVIMAGRRIDTADSAYHLRSEKDVVDRDNLEQEIDSRLVVDARIEEDAIANRLIQQRPLQIL